MQECSNHYSKIMNTIVAGGLFLISKYDIWESMWWRRCLFMIQFIIFFSSFISRRIQCTLCRGQVTLRKKAINKFPLFLILKIFDMKKSWHSPWQFTQTTNKPLWKRILYILLCRKTHSSKPTRGNPCCWGYFLVFVSFQMSEILVRDSLMFWDKY